MSDTPRPAGTLDERDLERVRVDLTAARQHMRRDIDAVLAHAMVHGHIPRIAVTALLMATLERLALASPDPSSMKVKLHLLVETVFLEVKAAKERSADA